MQHVSVLHSSVWLNTILLNAWTTFCLPFHPPVDGHLATVNTAVRNIDVQECVWAPVSHPLGMYCSTSFCQRQGIVQCRSPWGKPNYSSIQKRFQVYEGDQRCWIGFVLPAALAIILNPSPSPEVVQLQSFELGIACTSGFPGPLEVTLATQVPSHTDIWYDPRM